MGKRNDHIIIRLDDRDLRFCINLNALAEFEEVRGINFGEAVAGLDLGINFKAIAAGQKPAADAKSEEEKVDIGWNMIRSLSARNIRALWYSGLIQYQKPITLDEAGALIHQGNLLEMAANFGNILAPFFPSQKDVEDAGFGGGEGADPLGESTGCDSKQSPPSTSESAESPSGDSPPGSSGST